MADYFTQLPRDLTGNNVTNNSTYWRTGFEEGQGWGAGRKTLTAIHYQGTKNRKPIGKIPKFITEKTVPNDYTFFSSCVFTVYIAQSADENLSLFRQALQDVQCKLSSTIITGYLGNQACDCFRFELDCNENKRKIEVNQLLTAIDSIQPLTRTLKAEIHDLLACPFPLKAKEDELLVILQGVIKSKGIISSIDEDKYKRALAIAKFHQMPEFYLKIASHCAQGNFNAQALEAARAGLSLLEKPAVALDTPLAIAQALHRLVAEIIQIQNKTSPTADADKKNITEDKVLTSITSFEAEKVDKQDSKDKKEETAITLELGFKHALEAGSGEDEQRLRQSYFAELSGLGGDLSSLPTLNKEKIADTLIELAKKIKTLSDDLAAKNALLGKDKVVPMPQPVLLSAFSLIQETRTTNEETSQQQNIKP